MRFSIQREAFLKPLRIVSGVVERKHSHTLPILLNALIKIKGNKLSLTTSDQEVEMVSYAYLEKPLSEEAALTLAVRKLLDIGKALPEGENVDFIQEEDRVTIRSRRSRFTLSTLPASEFPSLSGDIGGFQFQILKKSFKHLIEQAAFAMADQDVRYYLNGMLLEARKGYLYAVAADGHRLAFAKIALSLEQSQTVRVIVPRKGILELQRILEDSDEEITVILGKNHVRILTTEMQLTSKLLDGRFPDYERLIATLGDKVFTADREVLKESFQRAAALFNDRFKGVRLKLTQGFLKILAINQEQDEVEEDVEIDYQGPELEIGFNIKYLIDFLNVIPTSLVKFTFSDSNSSARVEGVGEATGIYIIMPMRI